WKRYYRVHCSSALAGRRKPGRGLSGTPGVERGSEAARRTRNPPKSAAKVANRTILGKSLRDVPLLAEGIKIILRRRVHRTDQIGTGVHCVPKCIHILLAPGPLQVPNCRLEDQVPFLEHLLMLFVGKESVGTLSMRRSDSHPLQRRAQTQSVVIGPPPG